MLNRESVSRVWRCTSTGRCPPRKDGGIETAQSVAEHQIAVRETSHVLVEPPLVGRESVAGDLSRRSCVAYKLMNGWYGKACGKSHPSRFISRRIISGGPYKSNDPAVAFSREDPCVPGTCGCTRYNGTH